MLGWNTRVLNPKYRILNPISFMMCVQPVIRGIQSQGVVANAKHYINNNQEGLPQDLQAQLGTRMRLVARGPVTPVQQYIVLRQCTP